MPEETFNTITVPLGGEYGVILSDGTQVWLNSGSTLKYPVTFKKDKRGVSLNGEAFFKVAKSAVPFVVRYRCSGSGNFFQCFCLRKR